jgi:hypothetical protein
MQGERTVRLVQDICTNILATSCVKDAGLAEAIARDWVRRHTRQV